MSKTFLQVIKEKNAAQGRRPQPAPTCVSPKARTARYSCSTSATGRSGFWCRVRATEWPVLRLMSLRRCVPRFRVKIPRRFREQQRVVLVERATENRCISRFKRLLYTLHRYSGYPAHGHAGYRNLHIECQGSVKAIQYLRRYRLFGLPSMTIFPAGTSLLRQSWLLSASNARNARRNIS